MRVHAAGVVHQRQHGVGMRKRDGQLVEFLVVRLPEQVGRRHLQHDRLRRDLHRRHRDLVLAAQVLQRFQLRIARDEIERIRRHRGDALHADIGLGARPQRDQRRRADRAEMHVARQQPVIDDARPRDLLPVGLHLDAGGLGVLLDQASRSISISGRNETPNCCAMVISASSARGLEAEAASSSLRPQGSSISSGYLGMTWSAAPMMHGPARRRQWTCSAKAGRSCLQLEQLQRIVAADLLPVGFVNGALSNQSAASLMSSNG